MDSSVLLRQLLRTPRASLHMFAAPARPQSRTFALLSQSSPSHTQHRYISLPRIIQPSFWASLIPKPLRRTPNTLQSTSDPSKSRPKPKEWNPATPYIILSLFVGSQAIQILWLKRERDHFTRRAEAKIGVLREVIERVQRGEEVDVEKVLGTGDVAAEREWREVLKEVEEEEVLFRSKKRRRVMRRAEAEQEMAEMAAGNRGEDELDVEAKREDGGGNGRLKVESYQGARFY